MLSAASSAVYPGARSVPDGLRRPPPCHQHESGSPATVRSQPGIPENSTELPAESTWRIWLEWKPYAPSSIRSGQRTAARATASGRRRGCPRPRAAAATTDGPFRRATRSPAGVPDGRLGQHRKVRPPRRSRVQAARLAPAVWLGSVLSPAARVVNSRRGLKASGGSVSGKASSCSAPTGRYASTRTARRPCGRSRSCAGPTGAPNRVVHRGQRRPSAGLHNPTVILPPGYTRCGPALGCQRSDDWVSPVECKQLTRLEARASSSLGASMPWSSVIAPAATSCIAITRSLSSSLVQEWSSRRPRRTARST